MLSALFLACACTAAASGEPPATNSINDLLATGSGNVFSKDFPDYGGDGGGGISDYFYGDPYSTSRRSDMVASYTGGNELPANLNHRMQEIPLSFDLQESRVDRRVGDPADLDYHHRHADQAPWPSSEPMTFTHWTKHLMQEHSAFAFTVYFTVTFLFAAFFLLSALRLIFGDAASVDFTRLLPAGYGPHAGEESAAAVADDGTSSGAERVFKMIENFTEKFIFPGTDSVTESVAAENTTEVDLTTTAATPFFAPVISTTLSPRDESSTERAASLRSDDDVEDDYDENSINSMLQGLVHNQEQLAKMPRRRGGE